MGLLMYGLKYLESENNTGEKILRRELKAHGVRFAWAVVVIWFSANLLSQALYMGINGGPYDASAMLSSLGAWYWVLLFLELGIWVLFGLLVLTRIKDGKTVRKQREENLGSRVEIPPITRPIIDNR